MTWDPQNAPLTDGEPTDVEWVDYLIKRDKDKYEAAEDAYSEALARSLSVVEDEDALDIAAWNYRVVELEDNSGVVLIEAYYNEAGTVEAWAFAGKPFGNDTDDLAGELENMLHALSAPVLKEADLPRSKDDDDLYVIGTYSPCYTDEDADRGDR